MSDKIVNRAHKSFWVIGVIGLLWHGAGVANMFIQITMSADMIAALPDAQRMMVEGRPAWATGAFAISVFAGSLGCLLLLMKKSAAKYLFVVTSLAVIVTMIPMLGMIAEIGMYFLAIVSSLLMAVFLVWYSKFAERKQWTS